MMKMHPLNQQPESVIVLLISLLFATMPALRAFAQTPPETKITNAGLKLVDFVYKHPSGDQETLTTSIWYPTNGPEKEYSYMGSWRKSFKGKVSLDAAPIEHSRPFPVLLYITGLYGGGASSSFLAEYLARHGYVVVGPDFNDTKPPTYKDQVAWNRLRKGNTFKNIWEPLKLGREFFKDMEHDPGRLINYLDTRRISQALFIIEQIVKLSDAKDSFFYRLIDKEQIGLCGHSLGGVTVLAMIGCDPEKKYYSSRVKAALLLSPGVYPFEKALTNIRVPMMVMVGEDDPPNLGPSDVPRQTVYFKGPPPKYLCIIKGGEHLDFTNDVCGNTLLDECVRTKEKAEVICSYGLAFLDKYLRHSDSTSAQLDKMDKGLVYYAKEIQTGKAQEWGDAPGTAKKDRPRLFKR
jgi:predicted dienelactone hydrolase